MAAMAPVTISQINQHMAIILDESKNIANGKKVNQEKLTDSLKIATNVLKITGILYNMTDTPDLSGVVVLPAMDNLSLSDTVKIISGAKLIAKTRNEFLDIYKKLPEDQKKQFEQFIKANEKAMSAYKTVIENQGIEDKIATLPMLVRPHARKLLESSLRTQ